MNAMHTLCSVGTCAVAVTLLAAAAQTSWFEARTTGAKTLTLRGAAEFGSVPNSSGEAPFVLALGATSATGAVLFTIPSGRRPEPGVYDLADSLRHLGSFDGRGIFWLPRFEKIRRQGTARIAGRK